MIDFAYPWLLLLLLLVPLIAYYCVFRQKQPSVTVSTVAACALCAYCRPRPSPGR